MNTENPLPEQDPELPNSQAKRFKPAFVCCIILTITLSICALGYFLSISHPPGCYHPRDPARDAISNSKRIGLVFFEFEADYGEYPNEETAIEVTNAFPSHGYDFSGNSSNAAFRQLIAAGIVNSEEMFYYEIKGSKKPDGDISPGHALEKGECCFAYISGFSAAGDPSRIVAIGPAIPGTKKFDPILFDGGVIVLRVDQSASGYNYKIQKDGTIHDKDGDILSPNHPIWKGKAPDIHYPE